MKYLAPLLVAFALVHPHNGTTAPQLPQVRFPERVTSVEGKLIDVAKLGREQRVVVVTLKATWCRVCQEQLYRIKARLPLSHCGVTFLVLSPGPVEALKSIQKRTGFPYPFVEDRDLAIAKSLGLKMSEAEMMPAILILRRDRSVGWMLRGRGPSSFPDRELLDEIDCAGLLRSAAATDARTPIQLIAATRRVHQQ